MTSTTLLPLRVGWSILPSARCMHRPRGRSKCSPITKALPRWEPSLPIRTHVARCLSSKLHLKPAHCLMVKADINMMQDSCEDFVWVHLVAMQAAWGCIGKHKYLSMTTSLPASKACLHSNSHLARSPMTSCSQLWYWAALVAGNSCCNIKSCADLIDPYPAHLPQPRGERSLACILLLLLQEEMDGDIQGWQDGSIRCHAGEFTGSGQPKKDNHPLGHEGRLLRSQLRWILLRRQTGLWLPFQLWVIISQRFTITSPLIFSWSGCTLSTICRPY